MPKGVTHGLSGTDNYGIWRYLRSACENSAHPHYKTYGARGISMCEEWKSDVTRFCRDIGTRPSRHHKFKLIDPSKGISPGNVGWRVNKTVSPLMGVKGQPGDLFHETHK